MSRDNYDYDEFATMSGGKLFSNSVRGFNKEEVIAYIDDIANTHQRERRADQQRITQLSRELDELQTALQNMPQGGVAPSNDALYVQLNEEQQYSQHLLGELEMQQQHIAQLTQDVEFFSANNATNAQQEADLQALHSEMQPLHEQLLALQNDNSIWQEEYQNAEQHIFGLQSHIDQLTNEAGNSNEIYQQLVSEQNNASGLYHQLELAEQEIQNLQNDMANFSQQTGSADQEIAALRQQVDEAWDNAEYYRNLSKDEAHRNAEIAASSILSEATAESARIKENAVVEKERLHRQIKNAASGISESVYNLRSEVAGIEGSVSKTLENMQHTLVNVLSALAQTEQDLSTFTVQVDRFPISSPSVTKQNASSLVAPAQAPAAQAPIQNPFQDSAESPVRKRSNVRAFRPTFSNSPTGGGYWSQSSEALQPDDHEEADGRIKDLSESLVDTLRQMMN